MTGAWQSKDRMSVVLSKSARMRYRARWLMWSPRDMHVVISPRSPDFRVFGQFGRQFPESADTIPFLELTLGGEVCRWPSPEG